MKNPFLGFAKKNIILFAPLAILVVVALFAVVSFVRFGAPQDPMDAKRLSDLNQIASAVRLYADGNRGVYPESLDVLVTNKYLPHRYVDPVTNEPYQYLLSSHQSFSICAIITDGSHQCVFSKFGE